MNPQKLTFSNYTQILDIEFRYTKQSLLDCSTPRNLLYYSGSTNFTTLTPHLLAIFDDLIIICEKTDSRTLFKYVGLSGKCRQMQVDQRTLSIENAVVSFDLDDIDNLKSANDENANDDAKSQGQVPAAPLLIEFPSREEMEEIKAIIDTVIGIHKKKAKKMLPSSLASQSDNLDALQSKKSSFFFTAASDSNATLYRKVSNLTIQATRPVRSTPSFLSFLSTHSNPSSSPGSTPSNQSPFSIATLAPTAPSFNTWIPDSQTRECMVCHATKFSLTVRRHHCRSCGRIICSTCSVFIENCCSSSEKESIPVGAVAEVVENDFGTSLVRICVDCNSEILAMESD